MVSEILDAVRARRRGYGDEFAKLARRMEAGAKVTAGDVERVLSAAGRSEDDLAALVAQLGERRRLRELLAEAERLAAERPKIVAAIAAADAELEKARARHEAAVTPLHVRLADCERIGLAAGDARETLVATVPDADLRRRLDETYKRTGELRDEATALRAREVGGLTPDEAARLDFLTRNGVGDIGEAVGLRARRDAAEAAAAAATARLARIEKDLAKLERDTARLEGEAIEL
jgi:hypothetical protein